MARGKDREGTLCHAERHAGLELGLAKESDCCLIRPLSSIIAPDKRSEIG